MKAGRELDALVAENVMGWHVYESGRCSLMARQTLPDGDEIEHIIATTHPWETADYSPSTDIAAAWQVVEKLMEKGWTVTLAPRQFEKYPENRFKFHGCRMVGDPQTMQSFSDHADTAPLAICLAALKAVNFEVPA